MKKKSENLLLTIGEKQRIAMPAIGMILIIGALILLHCLLDANVSAGERRLSLVASSAGIVYTIFVTYLVRHWLERIPMLSWVTAISNGVIMGLSLGVVDTIYNKVALLISIMVLLITILLSSRRVTYTFLLIAILFKQIISPDITAPFSFQQVLNALTLPIVAVAIIEIIASLKTIIADQMRRLETFNHVARSLASSLEIQQVMALLTGAIQKTFDADTYYVGLVNGQKIQMELFYDDGEFFPSTEIPIEGTLAGWVVAHRQMLYAPNLSQHDPTGQPALIIGQQKDSLSWLGVPMQTGSEVLGLVAVASYRPNAFDRGDINLLENVAQQAALAIDNAYHHAYVEKQSHLDSLTGAFNHGFLVRTLMQEAENTQINRGPLSLIMLDIDHFKRYNDTYGHLMGDRMLVAVTQTIQQHIKSTDAVGRWGGEEFAIVLPNTNGEQALQVAERIRETLAELQISKEKQVVIPAPTVSQGIAVYPDEAQDIYSLIDLADRRLYQAKERGRDQIEPGHSHWKEKAAH